MSDKRATIVSAVVVVGAIALALSVGLIFLKVNPETRYNFRGLQRVERDLAKVKRILGNFVVVVEHPGARRRVIQPPAPVPGLDKQASSPQASPAPSKAETAQGVGKATPKHQLAPSAPATPHTEREHTAPPPEEPEAQPEPLPQEQPSAAGGPGTNVTEAPKRPELPVVPVEVEVSLPAP